jgi:predicted transcriptional regulator of viral defense system
MLYSMNKKSLEKAKKIFLDQHGLLRTDQAIQLGIAPRTLYAMREAGQLIQESRGVYRLAEVSFDSQIDLAHVALRVPKGVICLISALAFHELTTQIPHAIYLALPNQAERPRLEYPRLRLFWLSVKPYTSGIEEHMIEGVTVRIYGVEKTIADCFKFRNKIGLDVALEALREALRYKRCSVDGLLRYAQIDRVERIIRPYLEALV